MNIDNKEYCDECKKEIIENDDGSHNDCLWSAKDGREYCDHCYSEVFYPKWYGFSRSNLLDGKAGWTIDKNGNVVKIHD